MTTIPRTNRNSNRCGAVLRALCVAMVARPTPPWHYLTLSQASHTLELSAFGLPCSSIHFMYQLEHQPLRNPPKFGEFFKISRTFARFAPFRPTVCPHVPAHHSKWPNPPLPLTPHIP